MARFESDRGGPKPEPSVLRALRAIDPNLRAIWRWYYVDRRTGGDLLRLTGDPIPHPRWHVVMRTRETSTHLFEVCDEHGDFAPLDHRVPAKIRADVARHLSADQILQKVEEVEQGSRERRENRYQEIRRDVLQANRRKLGEIFEGGNLQKGPSENTRDAKILSYPGQPIRRSGFDSIPTTPKEEGWEMPDLRKEMA